MTSKDLHDFTDFIISGHSFGGYVAGFYTLRYPQHVKKLLCLSPIGYKPIDGEEITEEDLENKFRILKTNPKWFVELARFTWKNRITPFSVNRFLGPLSYELFEGYIDRMWKTPGTVKEEQLTDVTDYIYQIIMRDGTTELAPMIAFNFFMQAFMSLGSNEHLA